MGCVKVAQLKEDHRQVTKTLTTLTSALEAKDPDRAYELIEKTIEITGSHKLHDDTSPIQISGTAERVGPCLITNNGCICGNEMSEKLIGLRHAVEETEYDRATELVDEIVEVMNDPDYFPESANSTG